MFINAWKACFIVAFVHIICSVALDATKVTYSGGLSNDSIPASELNALQDLYDATDGANWAWSSDDPGIPWDFTVDPQPCRDNWQGVICNYTNPVEELHIIEVFLISHNLHGTIPISIGNLTYLEVLELNENELYGTIPDSIGNKLISLKQLDFYKNSLEGLIPSSLGFLSQLEFLSVEDNMLTGPIPSTFAGLISLETLALSNNYLIGPIPDLLGTSLHSLVSLDLEDNEFTGSLPSSLCQLSALWTLSVETNKLRGQIPSCLGDLSMLIELIISNNDFSGTIPPEISRLPRLEKLSLFYNRLNGTLLALSNLSTLIELYAYGNDFTGQIPIGLCDMHRLSRLVVHDNALNGTIPSCLGTLKELTALELSTNRLSGTFPMQLCQLSRLENLWLNNNYLHGSLPAALSNLTNLIEFIAQNNYFTGRIPDDLASANRLQQLLLYNNVFSGTIPASIGKLTSLQLLYLYNNRLTGAIPSTFKGLSSVEELYLQNNMLSGSIDGVFNDTTQKKLTIVQLSYNSLVGTLPPEAFLLPQLTTFVAVSNCFTGTLPDAICNNHLLSALILDGVQTACRDRLLPNTPSQSYVVPNNFQGTIPACLFTMPNLSSLHISGNGLKGTLPDVAAVGPRLIDLTVSYNALTGTIPHAFQLVTWKNLDLSYNRLTGTLVKDFASKRRDMTIYLSHSTYNTSNTTVGSLLDLQNNRLSGHVPTTLLHLHNVSVLGTNLFSCKIDRSDLPEHNQNRDNYECGSDSFNIPFYAWLGLVVFAAAAGAIGLNYGNLAAHFPKLTCAMDWLQKWTLEDAVMPRNFRYVCAIADILCKIGVWCTGLILVVLVPWYAAASHYFGTYYQQYAWTISAAFLSGSQVIGFEIFAYLSLMLFLVASVGYLILQYDQAQARNRNSTRTVPLLVGKRPPRPPLRRRVFVYTLYFLVNLLVVASFNVLFVLVALYENNTLLLIAQSNVSNNLSESTFSSVMSYDTLQREIFFPYFDADIFIISLITYLGILLTFGVVFPPLALTMAVTMISVSWQGKLAVGRFLYQARELNAQKFVDIIEQECRGAVTIPKIRRSIFIIICFCCSFYALFMYDTLGNDKGQMSSIWVLVFLPLFPLLIYGAIRLRRWQQGVLNLDFDLASAAAAQTEGLPMKVLRKQGGDTFPTSHSSDMLAPGNVSNENGNGHTNGSSSAQDEHSTYNVLQV
eukprot:gene15168-17372_t